MTLHAKSADDGGATMRHSPSRRTVLSGLIAVVLLIPTSAGNVRTAVPDVSASSADPTASEADALRFRATFGLQGGLEFVRSAARDPSRYSNMDYGVPLDAAEVAELTRRATIQATIDLIVEKVAANDTFAGMYLDQRAGGMPVFMFTADIADREEQLSRIVGTAFTFRTRLAIRTYEEFTSINDQIASSWDRLKADGIDIVRAGIRTDLNVVEIGVLGLSTDSSVRLENEFGPGIVVAEDQVAVADACNSISDCRPMKGGLKIHRAASVYCTSGFVVKALNTGGTRILTAGHCIAVNGGSGAIWNHNGTRFGLAQEETWNVGATRDGDVGLIDLDDDEVPTTKNLIHTTGTTVKTVAGWDSVQSVGDQSCRVGATWGLDCGEINAVNVTRASSVAGVGTMTVRHTNQVSFDSTGGDSGGSMYFNSGAYVIAQGTHVHSAVNGSDNAYGWFTPISWGRSTLEGLFGYDYVVCVNSSCS